MPKNYFLQRNSEKSILFFFVASEVDDTFIDVNGGICAYPNNVPDIGDYLKQTAQELDSLLGDGNSWDFDDDIDVDL